MRIALKKMVARLRQLNVCGHRFGMQFQFSKGKRAPANENFSTGIFIEERAAVIALQRQLFAADKRRTISNTNDEAVIALCCEKKLAEFLRYFLARQPNAKIVAVIRFAYR